MLLGLYSWYPLPSSIAGEMLIIGHLTGIIANAQPVIFVPEANKTTQFIKLCNASNTPIIYLHNVTGFMVGAKTEAQGLIKAGAQLVNAVSNSRVVLRKTVLMIGSSDQCHLWG
jgi:acetyl-CoA carboxylase carboxyltransferase component